MKQRKSSREAPARTGESFVVARGRISGTYADSFHHILGDGSLDIAGFRRVPNPVEREEILSDIRRHRKILLCELQSLSGAEAALRGES